MAPQLPLTSLLHPHVIHTLAGMYQGVSAKAAEHRKHDENDPKGAELGWRCVPLAVENYGAWGPEALKAFLQVTSRLANRGNTPKSKVVAGLYGRLNLLLIRANDRSILVRSYPQSTQQDSYRLCVLCVIKIIMCDVCVYRIFIYSYVSIAQKKKATMVKWSDNLI